MLSASALAIAPIPFLWLASDSFAWFVVIQIYAGVAWAGFDLGLLLALFDADDDAERTTMQVAFSALNAMGTAGASLIGGAVLAYFGSDHHAYLCVFVVSAVARIAAAVLDRARAAEGPRAIAGHRGRRRVDTRDPAVGRHNRAADRRGARQAHAAAASAPATTVIPIRRMANLRIAGTFAA